MSILMKRYWLLRTCHGPSTESAFYILQHPPRWLLLLLFTDEEGVSQKRQLICGHTTEGDSADILDDSKAHDTIFLRGKMWWFILRLFFSLKKIFLLTYPPLDVNNSLHWEYSKYTCIDIYIHVYTHTIASNDGLKIVFSRVFWAMVASLE